jgi:hypothetical protein
VTAFAHAPPTPSPFETPADPRVEAAPPVVAQATPIQPAQPHPGAAAAQQELFARFSVDEAVASASRDLDDRGITNVVTDGEAKRALTTLSKLPPKLQGEAIGKLSDDAFANLLAEVPAADRERFATLVENTHDPRRKLRLFERYHLAKMDNDLERSGAHGGKWFPSDEERREQERNRRRIGATKTSGQETRSDVAELLGRKRLTEASVDRLIEAKTLEHELEMKYALSFTHGENADWQAEDLRAAQKSLAQLPQAHTRDGKLRELRREAVDQWGFDAAYADGTVKVFTSGAEDVHSVTHEIGHGVAEQHPDAYEEFQRISGWQHLDGAGLAKAGIDKGQRHLLDQQLGKDFDERKTVHANGKIYQIDPYSGRYLAVDETAIPAKGETSAKEAPDEDHWAYPRSSPKEHFAELYARAADAPQEVYADLVELPGARAADAQKAAMAAQAAVESAQKTGGDVTAAKAELRRSHLALAQAQQAQRQRSAQFALMRNDVYDTDTATKAAVARLGKRGVAPGVMKDFEDAAAKVSTPAQLAALEKQFR